jgi:hypothetical protein
MYSVDIQGTMKMCSYTPWKTLKHLIYYVRITGRVVYFFEGEYPLYIKLIKKTIFYTLGLLATNAILSQSVGK